jgi:hypothetical protein
MGMAADLRDWQEPVERLPERSKGGKSKIAEKSKKRTYTT